VADQRSNRFLGSVTTKYFPADWVTFEGTFAYDYRGRVSNSISPKGSRSTSALSATTNGGSMAFGNNKLESINGSLTATFRSKLATDLNGKMSFRGIYDDQTSETNNSGGQIFRVKDIFTTTNTTTNKTSTSTANTTKNIGVFAGMTLDYKDRYVLEGSFRYDGSSRFGSGHRWSPFGRISGVWQVSHEPFWKVPFMDEFRLRASRGTAGTTPQFDAQYEVYTVGTNTISLDQAGNSQLRPETTTEIELGTDFTLFRRLGFEITYAYGKTKDQILPVSTAAALGFTSQWQNAGTLSNRTWEVSLNLPVVNSKSLYWQMRGTWDRTRTQIDALFVPASRISSVTTEGGTQRVEAAT
jgi:outer membrane receptor for ferrienterochelin and colicin